MIRKPPGCSGCPFAGLGDNWVPDEIRPGSRVFVIDQNPGAEEEAQGRPFVGRTGEVWERKYLKQSGLTRDEVSVGNVIRCRVRGGNELPKITERAVRDAIAHCQRAHFKPPESTRVIVSQGAYSLYGLTGESDVDSWRGYALDVVHQRHLVEPWCPDLGRDVTVLATVHTARLFRDPILTLATLADWAKLARLLAGTWPRKPPAFDMTPPHMWPRKFAFDTEYDRDTKWLQRWSAAWRSHGQPKVHVVEARDSRPPWFEDVHKLPTVVSQYTPADMKHLARVSGRRWQDFTVEDSVWKHSVLYSDHPHDLNYLGSIWSSMNRWKHLSSVDPTLYAGCDAWGLWEIDEALEGELTRDPKSRYVWGEIDCPATPHFIEAQYAGLRVSTDRLSEVITTLGDEARDAQARATAIAGWPIKLSSPAQVAARLFGVERLRA